MRPVLVSADNAVPAGGDFALAAYRKDLQVRWYAYPVVAIGAVIAAYHSALQVNPGLETGACGLDVPCSVRYIWEFGFISFPLMSLVSFALIFALVGLDRTHRSSTVW